MLNHDNAIYLPKLKFFRMAERKQNVLKIVLLGDSGVGKSSLLGQYNRQEFDENITVN